MQKGFKKTFHLSLDWDAKNVSKTDLLQNTNGCMEYASKLHLKNRICLFYSEVFVGERPKSGIVTRGKEIFTTYWYVELIFELPVICILSFSCFSHIT